MADTVRIGITGTGGLGSHLARGINSTDDGRVVAIADVSDENRAAAGDRFDIPEDQRYTEHEEMLDNADLDGVAIATPHTLHYDQVVAALDRGLDVLCEKPLCTSIEHAKDLVRRDEEGDELLMVGYQRHLDPAFVTVNEQLGERVGEPEYITAEITQNWWAGQQGAWRSNPDLSGGGQLYDTGSHLLDAVLWTTGLTPTSVDAQMKFGDDEERVDIQAALNVTFENDAVASIAVSGDVPRVREHVHFWGEHGAAYVDGEEWDPREVTFLDGDSGDESRPRLDQHSSPSKTEVFVDLVRDGGEPPATARDALAVTAVTEAAYESARTGKRVELDLEDL